MASPENEVRKYLNLVLKRRFLFAGLAVVVCSLGILTAYLLPKKYEAKSTVFIEKSVLNNLFKGMAVTPAIEERLKVLSYALSSRSLLQKVIEDLDVDLISRDEKKSAAMIEKFQRNTEVAIQDNDLFTITYRDENPRLARDYVNTLVRKYIEENLSASREGSYGANRFLLEQMEHFRQKLRDSEARLTAFKQKEHYLVTADESVLLGEIKADQAALEELRILKNQAQAKKQLITRGVQGGTAVEHLAELQRRRDQLLLTYTNNYPEVQLVNAEIAQVKQAMRQGRGKQAAPELEDASMEGTLASIELTSLVSKEEQLNRSLEEKRGVLASLPEKRRALNELVREYETYKATYDQLVGKYGQSEVSKQMELQDKADTFRIVDPAIMPRSPANPNRIPLILFSVVAGFGIGFAIVYLLDAFDPSLKGVDDIQTFGLPVLALVPRFISLDERLRERKKTVALTAFMAVYLVGVVLILVVEILQLMGLPVTGGQLQSLLSEPRHLADLGEWAHIFA